MKRAMEALNTAQHKAAEVLYQRGQRRAGAGQAATLGRRAAGASAGGGAEQSGDVIDAEVVEEEKK